MGFNPAQNFCFLDTDATKINLKSLLLFPTTKKAPSANHKLTTSHHDPTIKTPHLKRGFRKTPSKNTVRPPQKNYFARGCVSS
jgi:hypothetical protein